MRRATIAILPVLALAAGGCGNDRAKPPEVVAPSASKGYVRLSYPRAGVRLQAPANWHQQAGQAPLVATIVSGSATIAIWRYPRREPLPTNTAGLRQVRRALVLAVRQRDPTAKIISAKETIVQKIAVIQLLALETISDRRRKVRSTHFFDHHAEFVVDQYAPVSQFAPLDRSVFRPMLITLRFSAPRKRG